LPGTRKDALLALVRPLKEGVSCDDFQQAWFPDQGFGVPARVRNARRVGDPRDLLSVGFLDLPVEELAAGLERVAPQNDGATT